MGDRLITIPVGPPPSVKFTSRTISLTGVTGAKESESVPDSGYRTTCLCMGS